MTDATKEALFSLIRSVLIALGTMLAAKGVLASGSVETYVGAVMAVLPAIWGVIGKYNSEDKAKAREAAAVNAGIVAVTTGVVNRPVAPATAPQLIKNFAPPEGYREPSATKLPRG